MACVELKNVSYRYPVSCAKNLRGINLSIEKGEFVAIIGKNGAGKTTLCNVIRGFIPHFYHGTITGSVTEAQPNRNARQYLALRPDCANAALAAARFPASHSGFSSLVRRVEASTHSVVRVTTLAITDFTDRRPERS